MNTPRIINIPLKNLGTHETIVVSINDTIQSVNAWNFVEDDKGGRTFFIEGVTGWQIHFMADAVVPVIR